MQYIVGLTGLIGSGKSIAGNAFKELGINVIDTDAIAHRITTGDGMAIEPIRRIFGAEFVNNSHDLDRVKMRELVFSKPVERNKLEKILHPLIFTQALNEISKAKSNYLIVMVPLLFKSIKYLNLIHRSIFIDCEESILIKRVINRSKITESEVRAVLKAQMPRRMQLILCDDVLYNNGSIQELNDQIAKINNSYKKLFATL